METSKIEEAVEKDKNLIKIRNNLKDIRNKIINNEIKFEWNAYSNYIKGIFNYSKDNFYIKIIPEIYFEKNQEFNLRFSNLSKVIDSTTCLEKIGINPLLDMDRYSFYAGITFNKGKRPRMEDYLCFRIPIIPNEKKRIRLLNQEGKETIISSEEISKRENETRKKNSNLKDIEIQRISMEELLKEKGIDYKNFSLKYSDGLINLSSNNLEIKKFEYKTHKDLGTIKVAREWKRDLRTLFPELIQEFNTFVHLYKEFLWCFYSEEIKPKEK